MTSKANDRFPLAAAMVTAVLAGPMLSFGLVFLQSLLTTGTGRLLGGEASPVELRAAFAWAQAPLLGLFLLWWPAMSMERGLSLPKTPTACCWHRQTVRRLPQCWQVSWPIRGCDSV